MGKCWDFTCWTFLHTRPRAEWFVLGLFLINYKTKSIGNDFKTIWVLLTIRTLSKVRFFHERGIVSSLLLLGCVYRYLGHNVEVLSFNLVGLRWKLVKNWLQKWAKSDDTPMIMSIMLILSTQSSHLKSHILDYMASRESYFNIFEKYNSNWLIPHNVINFRL